ncbi:MAG: endoribonuclease MazF [Bacteriovorax sp.]|nr:endoribonuclease MazF [Bacteriovorax sp.]
MAYIPKKGDIVWLNFTPQAGHQQKGKRPALILSPTEYNKKTGLAVCCPITSNIKGYPFEVILNGKKIKGAILSDYLKKVDWKAREIQFIEKTNSEVISEVISKIAALILD